MRWLALLVLLAGCRRVVDLAPDGGPTPDARVVDARAADAWPAPDATPPDAMPPDAAP